MQGVQIKATRALATHTEAPMTDAELADEIERAAILLETFAENGMVDKFLTGKRTPNSFLCEEVAKKLRDAIATLRRQPSSDQVLVRRDVIEFLRGASPLDGLWFGEARRPDKGRYWCRT